VGGVSLPDLDVDLVDAVKRERLRRLLAGLRAELAHLGHNPQAVSAMSAVEMLALRQETLDHLMSASGPEGLRRRHPPAQ
jgi:hypothetical protein